MRTVRMSVEFAGVLVAVAGCRQPPLHVETPSSPPPTLAPRSPREGAFCDSAKLSDKDALDYHVWMSKTREAWTTLRAERRSEGEDATSRWDYVRLSDGSGVRLLRVIWNGGAQSLPEVTDYFFRDGRPVVAIERVVAPDAIDTFLRGPGTGRETLLAFAVFDRSGSLAVWLDGHDHPVSTSCEQWRLKEESYKSFVTMRWD
jgi:hypothetical protein